MERIVYLSSLVFLVACAGLPPFPKLHPKFVDSEKTLILCETDDAGKLKCDDLAVFPIEKAKGHFCLPPADITATRRWAKDVQENYTCKLK